MKKQTKEVLPEQIIKKYPKAKWQSKGLGEIDGKYILGSISDGTNEVVEYWKKI